MSTKKTYANVYQNKSWGSWKCWKEEAINKATDNATIDIPQAMIDTELDRMVQEFGQRIQQQGLDLQTYFQISGQDESQLREQMKDDAEQRIKTNLTLSAIADKENIEANDEDIDKELEKWVNNLISQLKILKYFR